MDKILSDEELDALLSLYRSGKEHSEEPPFGETVLIENQELHRRFFRLQQSLEATMKAGGRPYDVKVTNLGLGGLFVVAPIYLSNDTEVDIDIRLPDPKAIVHAKSVVCWQKKINGDMTGLGIRFCSLDTDSIWMILANMKRALADQEDMP